jgi:hypothetical protein
MSPPLPNEYEPKYVSLESVPIEITDNYSIDQKREALFQAESAIEADRTGGWEIDPDELIPLHQSAVANLATYHLARSATNNSDVTLGDLEDGGDEKMDHANQYIATYEKHLKRLAQRGSEGQTGTYFGASGDSGKTISVNTGRVSRRHDLGSDLSTDLVHESFR